MGKADKKQRSGSSDLTITEGDKKMEVPDDYDIGVDLPATVKLADGVLKIVGCIATDEKQVIFLKRMTEDEYIEELGIENE